MVRTKSTLGAKATKMLDYINHIIRVELVDGYGPLLLVSDV